MLLSLFFVRSRNAQEHRRLGLENVTKGHQERRRG